MFGIDYNKANQDIVIVQEEGNIYHILFFLLHFLGDASKNTSEVTLIFGLGTNSLSAVPDY